MVENTGLHADRVLVVYLPKCHESLAGIVAGRLRESYYKPVFVLTDAEEGIKGSGRSIEAYHMYEELSKYKDLFTKFGGHRLAAGLSLKKENLAAFCRRINENCSLSEEDLTEKVPIDMELPFSCVTEAFIRELSMIEPFGKGNTKPVFAVKDAEILSGRILGKNRDTLKLKLKDASLAVIDALYFKHADGLLGMLKERYGKRAVEEMLAGRKTQMTLSVTYYPGLNEYMGRITPQITVTHYR